MKTRPFALATALFLGCASSAVHAQGAENFPSRTLRLITGFQPGGVSDTIARVTGEKVGEILGQRVIIDGRPGAGGVLSMELAVNANPDGHTLYMGQPVITISPNFKNKPPFDPIRAFAPVSLIGFGSTMMVVHPQTDGIDKLDIEFLQPGGSHGTRARGIK